LRIGHSRLTQSYLLLRESQPECPHCQSPLTIAHAFTCSHHRHHFTTAFGHSHLSLHDILNDNSDASRIFKFIKAIGLYDKL
jgi:ABC-type nickel/cobalt efflux system permease component RcnA